MVLVVAAIGLVAVALSRPAAPVTTTPPAPGLAPAAAALAAVRPATFDAVGTTAGTVLAAPVVPPPGPAAVTLTRDGRPEILFVGSEFCPFCAAERWPLVLALTRFGRFTALRDGVSTATAAFPSLATFSFADARYVSPYLALTAVEQYSGRVGPDGAYLPSAALTPAQAGLVAAITAQTGQGAVAPVVDIAGRLVGVGSAVSPALFVGLSAGQITSQVTDPPDLPAKGDPPAAAPPAGRAVVAAANQLTAGMCAATGQRPASVCRSTGVREAAASLGLPPA